jgi:hypothetical protein
VRRVQRTGSCELLENVREFMGRGPAVMETPTIVGTLHATLSRMVVLYA